jgi:hypothetical protein
MDKTDDKARARELAIEAYDRFVMGGWQPKDFVSTIESALAAARVEGLREAQHAIKKLYRGYVNTLENGRDRIISYGGSCDPVDRMEVGDPNLREARATIAAIAARIAAITPPAETGKT